MSEEVWVLVRMKLGGSYFVLDKRRWAQFKRQKFYKGDYEAEVVAEGAQEKMFEFKRLTEES